LFSEGLHIPREKLFKAGAIKGREEKATGKA
jgi:hypothetical protein